MKKIIKTERYFINDGIVYSAETHDSLEAARDHIKTIKALDPDEKLAWNLLEIIFHPVEVAA